MTATQAGMPGSLPALRFDQPLALLLRTTSDGPETTRERVRPADLGEAHAEAWLAGALRRGRADLPQAGFPCRVLPLKREGGPRCTGFALQAEAPDGKGADEAGTARREFSLQALSHVAARAARRLITDGRLKADDNYYFELVLDGKPSLPAGEEETPLPDSPFAVTARPTALVSQELALPPLLARARTLGPIDEADFPVLYFEHTLARAERHARRGADSRPPVETGAALVGPLCRCPRTGEFFALVTDALEAHDAEGTQFSLTYSGRTWARIQAAVQARQAQPATRAHRLLGQAHGHNFLPGDGAAPCEDCHKRDVCTRTTVFVSTDDRTWMRASFPRFPFQLCHIFGFSARNDPVQALFGLRDGRLQERGYHVLPGAPD